MRHVYYPIVKRISLSSIPCTSLKMAAFTSFSRLFASAAVNSLRNVPRNILFSKQITPAIAITGSQVAGYRTRLPWLEKVPNYQVEIPDTTEEDLKLTDDVMKQINQQISTNNTGRLFAVVHVCGKQFKITENDIIIIQGYWPPTVGDKLKLEKVLLVGSSDFTLIGRPLVNRELVSITATVIEKTMSHTKTNFRFKKRKQYRRINFCRIQHTMLRINSIQVEPNVGHLKEVEGLDSIY